MISEELSILQNQINQSKFVNNLDLLKVKKSLYQESPFPHICIDDFWHKDFLENVSNEVSVFDNWAGEKEFYGSKKKAWQSDWAKLPPSTKQLLLFLNQPLMLNVIEFFMNERNLISDPYLEGGGIHSTGQNGFLKIHADFNWHEKLQLYRRINILIYLNKDWKSNYGGQIELARKNSKGISDNKISIDPTFNRTLIFITDDNSYHGQPKPVNHPKSLRRNSIAAYYYTSKKPKGSSYLKRTGTDYLDDSGKRIGDHTVIRLIKQKILSYLK